MFVKRNAAVMGATPSSTRSIAHIHYVPPHNPVETAVPHDTIHIPHSPKTVAAMKRHHRNKRIGFIAMGVLLVVALIATVVGVASSSSSAARLEADSRCSCPLGTVCNDHVTTHLHAPQCVQCNTSAQIGRAHV